MQLEIEQNKLNGVYVFRKYSSLLVQYNTNIVDVPEIIINMEDSRVSKLEGFSPFRPSERT